MSFNNLQRLKELCKDEATFEEVSRLIQEAEDRAKTYQRILSSTADGIAIISSDYRFITVNDAYRKRHGKTAEEIVGQHVADVLGQEAFQNMIQPNYEACLRGETITYDEWFEFRMIGLRYIRVNYSPYRHENGSIIGIVVNTRDITDEKISQDKANYHARLLDLVGDAVISTDADFNILSWNQAAERIYGWQEHEVLGKPFGEVLPTEPAKDGDMGEIIKALVVTGYHEGEFIQTRRDGKQIPIQTTTAAIYDENQQFTGSVAVNRDITEQKQTEATLRANEQFLRTIYEGSQSSIFVIDVTEENDFIHRGINPANEELIRQKSENLVGKRLEDIPGVSPEQIARWRANYTRCLQAGHPISFNETFFVDDNEIACITHLSPLRDDSGRIFRIVGMSLDITAQRKAEQAKEKLTHLELRLEKEREQREFQGKILSMITHDFKTPLSAILLSTDLMKRHYGKLARSNYNERLDRIQQQVRLLDDMIDEIITLKQKELYEHKLKPEAFDLRRFLHNVMSNSYAVVPYHVHYRLYVENCSDFYFDAFLLRQIAANLITNAVKYSSENGKIEVTGHCEDDRLKLIVKDYGKGIPEDEQDRIFEIFYRAGNSDGVKGTGIGLSTVKQAVEAYGGDIELESEVGVGTTFTVTLPNLAPVRWQ